VTEQELEKLAQQLGARAAARLDVERTAQAVVRHLRAEPRVTAVGRRVSGAAWLKIAAALVLLLGAGLVTERLWFPHARQTALVEPAIAGLSDLTTDQLKDLLQVVDQPGERVVPVLLQEAGLDDLTAPQLRELLQSLEG
jgi:hypothetical protein